MGHSIDFHAGALAPDEPMRTIAPGQSLTYRFTATKAGIWMYHCGTAPMSAHIANGMFGTVVIEPGDLPQVDKSFVLTQSDFYLAPGRGSGHGQAAGRHPGHRGLQWLRQPVPASAAQGPGRGTGADLVAGCRSQPSLLLPCHRRSVRHRLVRRRLPAGSPAGPAGGSQALALAPAQGGFVELVFPEAGHYPFVTHYMSDGERGAHGLFEITGENR